MRTARGDDVAVGAPSSPPAPLSRQDWPYWSDLIFGRTVPAILFGVFVLDQLLLLTDNVRSLAAGHASTAAYLSTLNRALSLVYFTFLALLYVVRLRPLASRHQVHVVVVSFVGTFAMISVAFVPGTPHGPIFVFISNVLITLGVAYALWGLLYLRRSFSIIPEARRLVTGGPYSLSRNPLYLGEFIASIGIVLPGFSVWTALVLVIFIACQLLRIHWEEQVLAQTFPTEYKEYFRRVPRLLPQPWPRKAAL